VSSPTGAGPLADSAALSRQAPVAAENHAPGRYTHRQRRQDLA
jgi:hypothetical protein